MADQGGLLKDYNFDARINEICQYVSRDWRVMSDSPTNWIDFLISLSPVAQTAIWAGVVVGIVLKFRKPVRRALNRLSQRITQGDDLETPWISLKRVKNSEIIEKRVEESIRSLLPDKKSLDHTSDGEVIDEKLAELIINKIKEWAMMRRTT